MSLGHGSGCAFRCLADLGNVSKLTSWSRRLHELCLGDMRTIHNRRAPSESDSSHSQTPVGPRATTTAYIAKRGLSVTPYRESRVEWDETDIACGPGSP